MQHEATACGCTDDIGMSKAKTPHFCKHGNLFVYVHQLGSKAKQNGGRTPLKQGKGMAASKAQQAKVKNRPCVNCERDRFEGAEIHAAHIWPRSYTPCACPEGVVPLCSTCHRLYDDPNQALDLLPKLIDRGYRAEVVHAFVEHHISLLEVIKEVTGVEWAPVPEAVAA